MRCRGWSYSVKGTSKPEKGKEGGEARQLLLTAAGDGCALLPPVKPISNSFVFRDACQQCVGVTGAWFQQCGVWWVVLWHHPRNCLLLPFKHPAPLAHPKRRQDF